MNLYSHLQVVLASPAAPASAPPPRAQVWAEPPAVQCLQYCLWPDGGSRVQRVQGLAVQLPGLLSAPRPGIVREHPQAHPSPALGPRDPSPRLPQPGSRSP